MQLTRNNKELMEFKFINDAGLPEQLKKQLSDLALKDEVAFLRICEDYSNGKTAALRHFSDIKRLAAALKASEFTYQKYRNKGIPDKIFFDTLQDIGIWCRENGFKGLRNYQWIRNHVAFELFKIGRLQFQLYPCKNPTMKYAKLPFSYGDHVINVHIPACGKLDYGECKQAFYEAVLFFERFFPEFHWDYFLCESWLVYGKNNEFMNANSNILKFDSLFNINYSIHYENQTYDRLFGLKKVPLFRSQIKKLDERTSLQKSAKAYRLSGNRFGIGIATIKKQTVISSATKTI